MELSKINIGIVHSLIGKNDGVSIVIDQTINAMTTYLDVQLDNIFLLSALGPSRFNKMEDNIFWHKNRFNKYILDNYSKKPPEDLDTIISEKALYAKKVVAEFVEKNKIDLLIVHNSCHPTNFIYAVAVGMYFEELRAKRRFLPRYLLWWHDSWFERERFAHPNSVIKKYLSYIPGAFPHGIAFINSLQHEFGRKIFGQYFDDEAYVNDFFKKKTTTVPNTCTVRWDWRKSVKGAAFLRPPEDEFNTTFFESIGVVSALKKRGKTIADAMFLLQHTRIVERKRIETALEYAARMQKKFCKSGKTVVLIISGHSGDEDNVYLRHLRRFYNKLTKATKGESFILCFAQNRVFPERELIVDKKFYKFKDIPKIIAQHGGLGTYFSSNEGFGNNLLEMMSMGLPVVINEYPIYVSDIKKYGFKLPSIKDGVITKKIVDDGYELLTDYKKRNQVVKHNLRILEKKLNHRIIAKELDKLISNMFNYL